MSSTLNDTIKHATNGVHSAKEHAEHAFESAKDVMESAKEGTEHTFMSTLAMLVKGANAVSGVVSMLRSLDRDDGLAWFGLARRRPLRSLGLFGAGIAVGAGLGALLTPMSGPALRRRIMSGERNLERAAKRTVKRAEAEMKEVEEKGEALVDKAKDAVTRSGGRNHERHAS